MASGWLLAPGGARWPGMGGTTIAGRLDDDRLAFLWLCRTGCSSREILNVNNHAHYYFLHRR